MSLFSVLCVLHMCLCVQACAHVYVYVLQMFVPVSLWVEARG